MNLVDLVGPSGALEKAVAPHSSTFAWKIPWTEEPGRLQSMGSIESDTTERLHFHFSGIQSDSVIHNYCIYLFFKLFSHLGYYRILNRLPCVIQYPCWLSTTISLLVICFKYSSV